MNRITIKVAAKINLGLKINGKYNDGYHNLDMLLSSVSIFDKITVSKRNDNSVNCFMVGKKCNKNNTAYKAALAVMSEFNTKGVNIEIKKGIPFSAGLGGSSADAAGVIYAMNELYGLGGLKNLEKTALKIGSDVPYMLYGGLAHVTGKGEAVKQIPRGINLKALIIKGRAGVSTKEVYLEYDRQNIENENSLEIDLNEISLNNLPLINDLQQPAIALCPEISNNLNLLKTNGADKVLMSGSGSAVFGIFNNEEQLNKVYNDLKSKVHYCKIANAVNCGITVINFK